MIMKFLRVILWRFLPDSQVTHNRELEKNLDCFFQNWISCTQWLLFFMLILGNGCKPKVIVNGPNSGEDTVQLCMLDLTFFNRWAEEPMALEHMGSATLVRYKREPQHPGVQIKRWEGDTRGQYKYVEIERTQISLRDFINTPLKVRPGFYQVEYNSVRGQPPSGFYGESPLFDITPGEKVKEVRIDLNAAI